MWQNMKTFKAFFSILTHLQTSREVLRSVKERKLKMEVSSSGGSSLITIWSILVVWSLLVNLLLLVNSLLGQLQATISCKLSSLLQG